MYALAIVMGHFRGDRITMSGWGLVFLTVIFGAAAGASRDSK